MSKLILFDIDGTLVLTGGAGGRAMAMAFTDVFDLPNAMQSISMAGRTDAWIVAQMAAEYGLTVDRETFARFRNAYIGHLEREIHLPGPRKGVLPGIRPVLDALSSRSDVHLGLLTGNFQRGARIKLEYFDLWRYFVGGAFGDDATDRNSLLAAALAVGAESHWPLLSPDDVVIVGDTPHDIAVATAGGARSLGVATGSYDVDALRASGADAVMEDLTDVEEALRAMGLAAGPG